MWHAQIYEPKIQTWLQYRHTRARREQARPAAAVPARPAQAGETWPRPLGTQPAALVETAPSMCVQLHTHGRPRGDI